jgi:metal-responsive CopG/Arc/MetJ family transcriptional regulator
MKVLVSLPDELYLRMRATIPQRQRSKVIAGILRQEVERREQEFFQVALAVEQDAKLNAEMAEWEATTGDGIDAEPG